MLSLFVLVAAAASFESLARDAAAAASGKRHGEAARLYRLALEHRPDWAEGWSRLGGVLYESDRCTEAVPALEKSVALEARAGAAWALLGICEAKLGREVAVEHLAQGRRLGIEAPLRSVAALAESLLLLEQARFDEAQAALAGLAPDDAEVQPAMGMAVLRFRPRNVGAADREMVRLAGEAELRGSAELYARLAAAYRSARNVEYAYGRFLLAQNKPEEAVAAFLRELNNSPRHLRARLAIAEVSLDRDAALARRYAEEAVAIDARIPLARYLLGMALLRTGEAAEAVAELETARTAMKDEPKIWWALSQAYAQAGRDADAEAAAATFAEMQEKKKP